MPKRLLLAFVLLGFVFETHSQVALRPKLSTKDEYRTCLKEEDALKAKREALGDEARTYDASLKHIQDEMQAHVATQPLPDRANDAAVEAFNEKIGALNARVNASNKEAERLNLEQYKLNTQIAAANQRCAGMVVSYPDHEAVRKERAEARKQR